MSEKLKVQLLGVFSNVAASQLCCATQSRRHAQKLGRHRKITHGPARRLPYQHKRIFKIIDKAFSTRFFHLIKTKTAIQKSGTNQSVQKCFCFFKWIKQSNFVLTDSYCLFFLNSRVFLLRPIWIVKYNVNHSVK